MALTQFKRGLSANIPAEKIDGCFYFTTDTGKLYLDIGTTRICLNPESDWTANSGNALILNKPTINKVIASDTQPSAGNAGDIWLVLE